MVAAEKTQLNLRVPSDLARELRVEAAKRGLRVSEYAQRLLQAGKADRPAVSDPPVPARLEATASDLNPEPEDQPCDWPGCTLPYGHEFDHAYE